MPSVAPTRGRGMGQWGWCACGRSLETVPVKHARGALRTHAPLPRPRHLRGLSDRRAVVDGAGGARVLGGRSMEAAPVGHARGGRCGPHARTIRRRRAADHTHGRHVGVRHAVSRADARAWRGPMGWCACGRSLEAVLVEHPRGAPRTTRAAAIAQASPVLSEGPACGCGLGRWWSCAGGRSVEVAKVDHRRRPPTRWRRPLMRR